MIVKSKFVCVRQIADVVLMPGNNLIDEKKEKTLKASSDFALDIKQNMLEIVSKSKLGLADMETSAAVKIVKEILDREELDEIVDTDKRSAVVTAAKAQLDKIKYKA